MAYYQTTQPHSVWPATRIRAGTLLVVVLWARWCAGIADNYVFGFLSEATALTATIAIMGYLLACRRLPLAVAPICAGLGLWFLSGIMSFFANPDSEPHAAFALLALLNFYFALIALAFLALRDERTFRAIALFLRAFLFVGSILCLTQWATGNGFVEAGRFQTPRAFGSDVHPVSFGIQIVIGLAGLALYHLRAGSRLNRLDRIIVALALVALYLTMARTAWMMALITFTFYMTYRRLTSVQVFAGLVILIVGFAFFVQSDRFQSLASLPLFFANFSVGDVYFDFRYVDNSISWRVVNWSYGIAQAMENPIFGHGPGQSAVASYFTLEMHNIFIEAFFEGGLFSLIALLVVVAGLLRLHLTLPNNTRADANARRLMQGLGLAMLLAVTFSTSLVDQLMTISLYVIVLAMACYTPSRC